MWLYIRSRRSATSKWSTSAAERAIAYVMPKVVLAPPKSSLRSKFKNAKAKIIRCKRAKTTMKSRLYPSFTIQTSNLSFGVRSRGGSPLISPDISIRLRGGNLDLSDFAVKTDSLSVDLSSGKSGSFLGSSAILMDVIFPQVFLEIELVGLPRKSMQEVNSDADTSIGVSKSGQ